MSAPPALDLRPADEGAEYRALLRRARALGLFARQRRFYARRIALNLALLGLGLAALPWLSASPGLLLLVALLLGFAFGQISFMGHDAAHHQITASARTNELLALLHFDLLLGISLAWWRAHHDAHHAHPNDLERDPDLRNPVLAFAPEHALEKRGLPHWIVRHQAAAFFALLLFEGLNVRCRSIAVIARGGTPRRKIEAGLMLFHLVAFHGYVLLALGLASGLAFLALHLALTGLYVGLVFAPNHTGMPVLRDTDAAGPLRRQVITARNVCGSALLDFWYGGLNYQIEHHLFPGVPRAALRPLQALVRPRCRALGIPYHETGIAGAIAETLRGLHRASAPIRPPRTG